MNVIYVSTVCDKKTKMNFEKNNEPLSAAAFNFNKKVIDGLELNGCDIDKVLSFPTSKDCDLEIFSTSSSKIKFIIDIFKKTIKEMKNTKKYDLVVVDVLSPLASFPVLLASKLFSIKSVGIITDLPQYIGNGKKNINRLLFEVLVNAVICMCSSYVLISKNMVPLFSKNKPAIVIEGLCEYRGKIDKIIDKKYINIVYTGSIQKAYGIITLIKAFKQISNDNIYLNIYSVDKGSEDYYKMLDKHVRDNGCLSYEEIVKVQNEATILVNPRPTQAEYTKFSFPSKLLDYLNSGTITFTTHLPGIPKEYDDYFNYFESDDVQGIKNGLLFAINNIEELQNKAQRGKDFVSKNKNIVVQTKRILDLNKRNI